MANIFYLRANTLDDFKDAHMRLTGGTAGAPSTGAPSTAGWYIIEVDSTDNTMVTTPMAVASGDVTMADTLYIGASAVGASTTYSAAAEADTYIITEAFADGVAGASSGTTSVIINDTTGANVYVFESGVTITGARQNTNSNVVSIGFTSGGTETQLTLSFTTDTRFKLGENGTELTRAQFFEAIGPTMNMPSGNNNPLTTAFEVTDPAATYTDTNRDDTFAITRGTFTATDATAFSVAGAVAVRNPGEFTHEVAGTYGTLRYHQTNGKWRFTPDDLAIEILHDNQTGSDTFAVTATNASGTALVAQNLVFNVIGETDIQTPTLMEDLAADDGKASITIHGITFTANMAGTGGNAFKIKIDDTTSSSIKVQTMGNTYTISITQQVNDVNRQHILNIWEGKSGTAGSKAAASTRMGEITATLAGETPDTQSTDDLKTEFGSGVNLEGGGPVIPRDVAVTLAYDDAGAVDTAASDLSAEGTILIRDRDGRSDSNITATATYGTVALVVDLASGSGFNDGALYDWTYTLNAGDPQTAALTAGMVKDTIIISFTDDRGDGGITTLEIEVDVTITGTAAHLADDAPNRDATRFNEAPTPPATEVDKAIDLIWNPIGSSDFEASGTLTITDTDGIASITHTAGQYGTFTFDEATGAWSYELDTSNPKTVALTAAATETITFTVADGADPANTATHNVEIAIAVTGTSGNMPPSSTPATGLTIAEDASHTFAEANFGFTAGDTGDTLKSVVIVDLPEVGTLTLAGTAVVAGQVIPAANIPTLVYNPEDAFAPGAPATPGGDPVTTSMATFTYAVIDSDNIRSEPATLSIEVTGIDDDEATEITLSQTSATLPANADLTEARKLADIEITDLDGGAFGTLELVTPGDSASAILYQPSQTITITAKAGGDAAGAAGNNYTFKLVAATGTEVSGAAAADKSGGIAFDVTGTNIVAYYDTAIDTSGSVTTKELIAAVGAVASVQNLIVISTPSAFEEYSVFAITEPVTLAGGDATTQASRLVRKSNTHFLVEAASGLGTLGNDISIAFVVDNTLPANDQNTPDIVEGVTIDVVGNAITVKFNNTSHISMPAMAALVNAHAEASKLIKITAKNAGGESESFAVAETTLTGGTNAPMTDDRFMLTAENELVLKAGQTLTAEETATIRVQLDGTPAVGQTYTLTVGANNDAPTATAVSGLTVVEENMFILYPDAFGFADTDSGDSLQSVTIETLPAAATGTLTLDGVDVKAGDVITLAEIEADKLVFNPANNLGADANATFTYSVSDGKHNSTDPNDAGISAAAAMMTIAITADDDPATGIELTNITETISANAERDGDVKVADITLIDPDGGTMSGTPELVQNFGAKASASVISGSTPRLVFTADTAGTGGNAITVTIRSDADLGASDKVADADKVAVTVMEDTSTTPATQNITITYNADFAVSGTATAVTLQDIETAVTAHTEAMALVDVTRTGDTGDMATAYEAAQQTLTGGVAMDSGPPLVEAVKAKTSFANPAQPTLVIRANEGGTDGNAITITVTPDDDLPQALRDTAKTQITVTGTAIEVIYSAGYTGGVKLKDIAEAINAHEMARTLVTASAENDGDGSSQNPFAGVFDVGETMLTGGATAPDKFKLNTAGTELQLIDGATLTEGDMLNVRVQLMEDNDVGVDYTLTIGKPNAIPTADDGDVDTDEDTPYAFKVADFGFMDGDTGDALHSVIIKTLPAAGMGKLTLDGADVSADDVILVADIEAGKLVYTPPATFNDDEDVTFTFSVSDGKHESTDALQSDGSTPVEAAEMTIDVDADDDDATGITVTEMLDPNALVNGNLPMDANENGTVKVADITFTDPDGGDSGTLELGGLQAKVTFEHTDPASPATLTATAVEAGAAGNGSVTIELRADDTLPMDDSDTEAFENIGIDVDAVASSNPDDPTTTAIVIRYNPAATTLANIEAAANADARVTALVTFSRENDDGWPSFAATAQPLTGGTDGSIASATIESDGPTLVVTAATAGEDGNGIKVTFVADDNLPDDDGDDTNGKEGLTLAHDAGTNTITVTYDPDAGITIADLIAEVALAGNEAIAALVTFSAGTDTDADTATLFAAGEMMLTGGAAMIPAVPADVAASESLTDASIPTATLVATAVMDGVAGNGLTITFTTDDQLPADDGEAANGKEGLTLALNQAGDTLTITYDPDGGITIADLIAEMDVAANANIKALVTFSVATGGDEMAALPANGESMDLAGGMNEVMEVVAVAAKMNFGPTGGTSIQPPPMLVITADDPGTDGNAITVTIQDNTATGAPTLASGTTVDVAVTGNAIVITYDASASPAVTLQAIEDAINADMEAMALVTASRTGDDDNDAMPFAVNAISLAGGVDGVVPADPVMATASFPPPALPALVIEADDAGTGGNAITVTIQSDADSGVDDLDPGVKVLVAVIEDTGTTPATQNIVISYNADFAVSGTPTPVTLKDIEEAVNGNQEAMALVTATRTGDDDDDTAAFAVAETSLTGGMDMAGPTDAVAAKTTFMEATTGLVVTAKDQGPDGNAITVTIRSDEGLTGNDALMVDIDPNTAGDQPERIRVTADGTDITITYDADANDGITIADLITAAAANADVNALVTFSAADDTATLFAAAKTTLTGGGSDIFQIVEVPGANQGDDPTYELHLKQGVTLTDSETYEVRVQLAENNGIGQDYSIRIGAPNNVPTAVPATGLTTAEDTPLALTKDNFGFMDDDADDVLVSITITELPTMGALLLNGVAVTENQVIMAADIGGLTYDPMDSFLTDGNATFMYTVNDGEADSVAAAEMSIAVTGANDDAPVSAIEPAITFDSGAFIFTRRLLDTTDPDTGAGDLTYTLATFTFADDPNADLEVYNTTTEAWVAIAEDGSGTFTQEQVDDGQVRLSAMSGGTLSLQVSDGPGTDPANPGPETITFTARVVEEVTGTGIGGAGTAGEIDLSTDTADQRKSVTTGIGNTTIKLGAGNDKVDAGLGDDVIDLSAGGTGTGGMDTVIYRFATDDAGNTIAWSGGDSITGFTPGEDALVLDNVGSGDASFISGLGSGFIATLSTAYNTTNNGNRANISSYDVTGVEIHFSQAVVLPGGVLGGSILSIAFDAPIAWSAFNQAHLNQGGFNSDNLLFTFNEAGRDALARILGLRDADAADQIAAQSSVAIGGDEADTIDLSSASVDGTSWVVFGDGGDDAITLGAGTEEVVYRLGVGDDPATAAETETDFIATTDGNDAVNGFTLGTDRITFVDTDGDALALADLLGAFDSVSLLFDGTDMTYTGISFSLVSTDSLRVEFATALDEAGLIAALGDASITDTTTLGTIFNSGSAPVADGDPSSLSAAGLALIDDLFGADNISVDDTLPAELL